MSKFTPFLWLSTVAATGKLINGNWYADSIERIAYTGVGGAGTYQRITNMESATGACSKEPRPFSGPLAPFDEDVSSLPVLCHIAHALGSDRLPSFEAKLCLVNLIHYPIYFAPGLGN
jgi:hypothetical protein